MGNTASSTESDDELLTNFKEDDTSSDGELENDKDAIPSIDLQSLFEHASLRASAAKVKDDMPENVVQQHQAHLLTWLEERQKRSEDTVTLAQFCDVLMGRSVGREEAIQAFHQFDTEGDGSADVGAMMEVLKNTNSADLSGELGYVVRTLQACTLTPGFIDVYNEDKQTVGQHGLRILNFLLRNRAPSSSLPFPILNGFNNTVNMRLSTVKNHFNKLKDVASRQQVACMLNEGEEMKTITRCWKSIEVSTNKNDAYRLTNSDFSSFWQSDGSARSHWIRLRMRNNVVIKQLSVFVAASDQSYMPQLIVVAVGKVAHSLHEIKEVRIHSHITGEVVLLENLKTYYPIIQLNIKRCHSDGCDTRIHEVKTLGYRIMKESTVSVMDASASWFLQVLASTATAAIPTSPALRTNILQHSKSALQYMMPLSLCPASSDRPQVLSAHVLKEVDRFLNDISGDDCLEVQEEALYVMLAFNLACGHVAGTLRALQCLQENKGFKLEATKLLQSLHSVRNTFWKKQSSLVNVVLLACDGGQKEATSGPQNVLYGNWTTAQAYLSGDGKTKVNMFFRAADRIQLTKIRFKVDKGPRGPKHGMVFVYNSKPPFSLTEQVEAFKKYDSWTATSYALASKCRSAGIPTKDDGGPVAFFTLEDDWDEVEVTMDTCPVGQYILIKFLEPRQPSAERLGIVGIKFHGFNRKSIFVDNSHLYEQYKIPTDDRTVNSSVVIFWTLDFLVSLSRDHVPQRADAPNPKAPTLDMTGVSVDQIWQLYNGFPDGIHQNLVLQLLHSLFPFLIGVSEKQRNASETLFKHLCHLVDNPPPVKEDATDDHLLSIARQVIIDGAAVFFPDKEARRKQLFSMMTDINGTAEVPSVSLVFQSLCQFFGSVDPSGLLDLPVTVEKGYDPAAVLAVMETLVSVAGRELFRVLQQTEVSTQASHLGQLLCSLQTALLCWCHRQISSSEKEHSNIAQDVLVRYVLLLVTKACQACQEFRKKTPEEMASVICKLEGTFLSTTVRQMVLIVMLLGDELSPSTHVSLLKLLKPLAQELHKIELLMPNHFYPVDSPHWDEMGGTDVVLRTWEVESPHNYENNVHTIQIFSCPGAATFTVEFDPRCETEKRYDYLEFTDSRGSKMRFDQKVGTEKWPTTITFKSGHRLQFHFHSDSSNNEWGYKFKVIATGTPDVPLCWMFDLHLSLAELLGQLCGATLDRSVSVKKIATPEEQDDSEAELIRSDLWTTLFRGGYRIGKLQWSLSHRYAAVEDGGVLDILWAIIGKEENGNGGVLLRRCQEHVTGPQIGGAAMDDAVIAVFCALLWHTQVLREELEKIENGKFEDCLLSDGIIQAYNIAHSVRQMLMVQRQNLRTVAEKSGEEVDVDEPVRQYTEKALYLLKFAGLQRVHIKTETKPKLSRQSSRFTRLPRGIKTGNMESSMEKYPSFRLVLEFVRDPAWSKDRVEELLKERSLRATAVSEVYMFASEYIRIMTNEHIFQVPVVLFLQHMLAYQSGFPQHYADGLDGCGLEQEGRVRQTFYALSRRLVEAIRHAKRAQFPQAVMAAYDYIQACTLHLLDINWQMYDLSFLVDIKLPDLYMNLAKGSVSMREKIVGEMNKEDELVEYKKDMSWLAECKKDFMTWYKNTPSCSDSKKAKQMFLAKFCDFLEVEVNCDGCTVMLPGRRYRCLQCEDMDLCTMCYAGGVKPGGEHTDDHEIVHMMYKCDECQGFIVGTRLHCKECEDFDLCLGCHEERHFPAGHSLDHEMETFPMVKLKLSKDSDSALQSYLHQHVWLLFASMSLSMAAVMYSDGNKGGEVHSDYIKACTQLHNMCLDMSTSCLRKVTPQSDEQEVDDAPETLELRQEEAFASHAQERVMGLLGAMIPPENKMAISTEVNYTFTSENFLQLLFQIASGESGHETNTQHLAMGLVGQLLQRSTTSCSSVDTAVAMATTTPIPQDAPSGAHTAEYLFSFGATCLERSGLEWANSMASILQKMFKSPAWKEVLLQHLSTSIRRLKQASTESTQSVGGQDAATDQARFEALFKTVDTENKGYVTTVQLEQFLKPLVGTEWKTFWMIARCVSLRRIEATLQSAQPNRKRDEEEQLERVTPKQFAFTMMLVESRHGSITKLVKDCSDVHDNSKTADTSESPLNNSVPESSEKSLTKTANVEEKCNRDSTESTLKKETLEACDEVGNKKVESDPPKSDVAGNVQLSCKADAATKDGSKSPANNQEKATGPDDATTKDKSGSPAELTTSTKEETSRPVETETSVDEAPVSDGTGTAPANTALPAPDGIETKTSDGEKSDTETKTRSQSNTQSVLTTMKKNENGPELASIFALFVIAGFPEVLSIGAPVRYTDFGTEFKKGVVLKHFPDKYQTLLVDRKTRRRKRKKDEHVECESHDLQVLDQQHICAFIEVIKDITSKVKQGACVSAENVWVGSLALKALLKTLRSGLDEHVPELYTSEFVQATIYLASQGTGFSKQWLLKDFEILSLMLYTRDQEKAEEPSDVVEKKTLQEDDGGSSSDEGGQDPWQGLDEAARHTFKTLHGHLDIPVAILRAVYDIHDQDANALIMAVHENASSTSNGVFIPTDEIKRMARKWEVRSSSTNMVDKSLDLGMQLTTIRPLTDRNVDKADEEATDESQKLIVSAVDAMSSETVKQRKNRSASMLKKELETQGKAGSRDFLLKVNMAMAILYARHVLMKLLADWPASIPLHIGCRDDVQVPFILDLLNRYDTQDTFQKVVRNVISCYSVDCVVPIGMAACQFLEEVNVSSVTKESEHQYKNNTRVEDKVTIPGVAYIGIHFDNRCVTEEGCDELFMASSSDYCQSKHVFSGPREHWVDFEMPGDTVYFKFESDGSNTDWGYKFTVTGRKIGRFDTGYMILKSIFAMPHVTRRLPLRDLWSSLMFVACKQTGQQRLKALHLTLKILQSQFKCAECEQLSIDLGLLRPLWVLYNKMSNSDMDASNIVPPVVRALTEVFLVAENLAMEWNVSRQYMASLLSSEDIHRLMFEGIKNIAAMSLMIGVTNKATEGLKSLPEKANKKKKDE